MDAALAAAAVLGGMAAGTMNAVAGAGSLISFPALVAAGLPPLTANVTNTVGIVAGSATAVHGYRREIADQWPITKRLALLQLSGAVVGAVLLLSLPAGAFEAVVPVLLLLAAVMVAVQPRLARWAARRRLAQTRDAEHAGGRLLDGGVLATGVYCGYFGAAQGVILLALLGGLLDADMQRANAVKNVLGTVGNLMAAVIFAIAAPVVWSVAALSALGALVGGFVGVRVAKRLPPVAFRAFAVVVALTAAIVLGVRALS